MKMYSWFKKVKKCGIKTSLLLGGSFRMLDWIKINIFFAGLLSIWCSILFFEINKIDSTNILITEQTNEALAQLETLQNKSLKIEALIYGAYILYEEILLFKETGLDTSVLSDRYHSLIQPLDFAIWDIESQYFSVNIDKYTLSSFLKDVQDDQEKSFSLKLSAYLESFEKFRSFLDNNRSEVEGLNKGTRKNSKIILRMKDEIFVFSQAAILILLISNLLTRKPPS